MSKFLLMLGALLVLSGCTTAPPESAGTAAADSDAAGSTDSATTQQAAAGRQNDESNLVCRNERVIGSRLPRRICATQRDWDAIREGSQETTRDAQRMPTGAVEEGG